MFIVRYDRGSDLSETVKCRRGENSVCGEDIDEIGLRSHDEVIACRIFRGAPHAETSSFLNVVIEDDIHLLTIEIEWKGIPYLSSKGMC